jgi:outer membrane protein TolC
MNTLWQYNILKELNMHRMSLRLLITTGILLNGFIESYAQTGQKVVMLSLDDCIARTLKYNLNVAIEVLGTQVSEVSIAQAEEKYLPQLVLSVNNRNTSSASYSWLDAADQVQTEYQFYTAQLTQLVPTGASLVISLENDKNNTNRRFQTINPRYGSTMRFNFSQPLLRNFGFKISNREIIIAQNDYEISENRFKSMLIETIYTAEEAYWNFVYSIENLKAREQSLSLARDLLEKNKRSVTIGRLASIDIQSAEAEVATREADILEAEAMVKNSEDNLKTLINLAAEIPGNEVSLLPVDKPVIEEHAISLEQAIERAYQHRPDLQEARIELKNSDLDLRYAKNQMLPDLNLEASLWSPGISGTQILYQNDDPTTGNIIGTVPAGPADALDDAFHFKYQNWSVGLSLNVPLNTIFARNQVDQAHFMSEQARLRKQQLEQQILLEIKIANRAVETNLKRVNAYRIARELTEKKLETEAEKLRLGISTNYDVFLFQRDLSDAKSSELQALIDYNLSLANRARVLGTSLEEKQIKISDVR